MSDNPIPPYEDVPGAPLIYFDLVACNGAMNGAIQIEVAQRVMVPTSDGGVAVKFATSGRIRCSPAAAQALIAGLEQALKMVEQPEKESASAARLN